MKDSFKKYAANESNPNWNNIISRCTPLYKRDNDIRTEFGRDYTRIIHCNAYRRLKHKTQVFFSPDNDHICTRIEHVTHVESISYTIATYLGLNTELTKAIAVSHDIGHSPFGHVGERILSSLSVKDVGTTFWHEKNGLDFVDYIELLEDNNKYKKNLNLTYGVRDGIISHCGEVSENGLKPRTEYINLSDYKYPNQFAPYTWEACVVKLSDKISYIGRDIEDAITLGILDNHLDELYKLLDSKYAKDKINNTIIINYLITDLCENSSPEKGLCFSQDAFNLINKINEFNYKYIYNCQRIQPSNRYFNIVLTEIYSLLKSTFEQDHTLENVENLNKFYPKLYKNFLSFLNHYFDLGNRENLKLKNQVVFNLNNEKDFYKAIIYFISGMTDNFAIEIYNEIIGF
mgnify:FL=1